MNDSKLGSKVTMLKSGVPLSTILTRIIWLCMLPLFLFGAILTLLQLREIHREQIDKASLLAKNVVLYTDNAINSRISALNMLAISPLVDDVAKWPILYQEAQGFQQSFGTHVVITDGNKQPQLLMSTRQPFGTKLPVVKNSNGRLAGPIAMRTGKPAVSDLFASPIDQKPLIGIAVPVIRQGIPKFTILTILSTDFFQDQIDKISLPPGWHLALKDAQDQTIAHLNHSPAIKSTSHVIADSKISKWKVEVVLSPAAQWEPMMSAGMALAAMLFGTTLTGFLSGKWAERRVGKAIESLATTDSLENSAHDEILEIAAARRLIKGEADRRMAVENALREKMLEYEAMFERSVVGKAQADPATGRFLKVNQAFADMLGYSPEELCLMTPLEITHPNDRERKVQDFATVRAGSADQWHNEKRYLRKDGTAIWVSVSGNVIHFKDGKFDRTIAVIQDISERKAAEEMLRESEELFRQFFDNAPLGKTMTSPQGTLKRVNPALCKMLGYSQEELANLSLLDITHPDDVSLSEECVSALLAGKQDTWDMQKRYLAKDGRVVWTRVVTTLLRNAQGQPIRFLTHILDITDRKSTENALRESELRFRLALRNAPVSVAAQNRDLKYIWAYNQRTSRQEGIIGHYDRDLFAAAEAAHLTSIKQRVLHENIEIREQMWFNRSSGRIFLDVCWVPIHDESAQVVGVASATVDLTQIKLVEEALKASLAEKEVLLKEIHHRVKNNMQVISSLVDLQADAVQDPAVRAIFKDVNCRVRSMAMVHEKLYQSADLAQVEFADYAQSLLGYLWRAQGSTASGIQLKFDMKPVFLSVTAAVPCGLILNELFTNALKHAFLGRNTGEVFISLYKDINEKVCLSVCDNGIGLPPDLDWEHSRSLGLRIVKTLVRQLHGVVEVIRDKGTQFTILFDNQQK